MDELGLFSDLVEQIYDASLDSSLWPGALEQVCAFVQGCAALLFYESIAGLSSSAFWSWGEDPHYSKLYRDKFLHLNPLFPSALFFETGKVYALEEAMPIKEFRETRLYKEWAQPQGILDTLRVNLERTATGTAALTVRRRERDGFFDAAAKSRLAAIVPHVRRAIAIGKVVEFQTTNKAALEEALDGLDAAVVLVARDGQVVHLNSAATVMLRTAEILRTSQGSLAAVDPRANTELQEAIAKAARGATGLGVKGVAILLTSDNRESKVAHVLSLTSGKRRGLLQSPAVAAVFVRKMTIATPTPLEMMAKIYGLTAAEIRVLASLAASTGVASTARMLGIGEATVKSHLHRLFTKTGAKRQADLIRLLAQHGSPLGS